MEWRQAFIRTFLERDLPALGVNIAADTIRRFWSMLGHHHAQLWNASEIGRSLGVADTTVRNYLVKLTDALVVRQPKPWHENHKKASVTMRRQLSLYVPRAEGALLEAVRRVLDPVQAGLIPAHVTLCREDELGQVSAMEIEARLRMAAAEPVTLGFGRPVS